MKVFGMGGFELVIILVVILLIFGPKNLPKLGSAIGKTVSNLRSGMNDGKKKKDTGAEDAASAEGQPEPQVAEIEGDVETVEFDSEPDLEPAAVSADEPDEIGDATEVGAAPAPAPAAPAAPAPAAPAAASKKVKRVVKKKAATEEPAETE